MNETQPEVLEKLRHGSDLSIDGPLTRWGSGYQNTAFKSANDWLIRLGRTQAAGRRLLEEGALLDRLAGTLSFPIPKPVLVEQSDAFPSGVMVYRWLPGVSLDMAQPQKLTCAIAEQLGAIIAELHAAAPQGSVRKASSQDWRDWLSGPREWLQRTLTTPERSAFDKWLRDIEADEGIEGFPPCVIHGDLWFDHVLVDPERGCILGIVDFGDAGWGDPAQDLATQLHMGRRFFDRVVAVYAESSSEPIDVLQSRIRWRWQLREVHGLWWAWKRGDRGDFEDALGKLRRGPIFGSSRRT